MRIIDFLSDSPKTFIFKKSSNKTTFGGFLTLIYGLIVLTMSILFYIDYHINDKYIISYSHFQKKMDVDEINERKTDNNYNPNLTFLFDVYDYSGIPLSENFLLFDLNNGMLLDRNNFYQYKPSDMKISILYNCSDAECSSFREEDEYINYEFNPILYFRFVKFLYYFNLQDDYEPIKLDEKTIKPKHYAFNPNIGLQQNIFWETTTIVEEQGILDRLTGNKKEYFGGSFSQSEISTIRTTILDVSKWDFPDDRLKSGFFKILYIFSSENLFNSIIEYKRKKISVIDLIANICSLALTIYNGFKSGFSFLYSSNFDNYNIIDRILSTKNISKITKKNENAKSPLLTELKEFDEENEYEYESEKEDKTIETKSLGENIETFLPKYNIFVFICNLFSCCCKNNKAQKYICVCNEIREKYYSIENILYNQFMIENLLKDYKWNNPDLKFIKNIQLIDKLNYIIDDIKT